MRRPSQNVLLYLAIALTVACLALPSILPDKTLSAINSQKNYPSELYLEQSEDGLTTQQWVSKEDHHWQCNVTRENSYLVCSAYYIIADAHLMGWDLSQFQQLKLRINYSGPGGNLKVYMRNYNPRYATLHDYGTSSKFQTVTLRKGDFNKLVTIDLTEFSVADWWIDSQDLPRNLATPEFSNIVILGFQFEEGLSVGEHGVEVESFYFSGEQVSKESLYLSVLVLWMLAAFVFTTIRIIVLHRKNISADKQINVLESTNFHLQNEKDRYETLSLHDPMTGTLNRQGVKKSLQHLASDLRIHHFTLILMDIDHFKQINDQHGHDCGDRILKQVAEVLRQNIRNEDYLARWGGEEFLLVCPQLSLEHGNLLAEKLRASIIDFYKQDKISVTASFGVGTFTQLSNFDNVFKQVDQALYMAKDLGRNRVVSVEQWREQNNGKNVSKIR